MKTKKVFLTSNGGKTFSEVSAQSGGRQPAVGHTPTPWRVHRPGTFGIDVISDVMGTRVCECNPELGRDERDQEKALLDAEFIVRAVNSFDAMKVALEAVKRGTEPYAGYIMTMVNQALSKAEGKE